MIFCQENILGFYNIIHYNAQVTFLLRLFCLQYHALKLSSICNRYQVTLVSNYLVVPCCQVTIANNQHVFSCVKIILFSELLIKY